jgi:hypothetical protein
VIRYCTPVVFKTWFVGNLGGDGDRGRLLLLLKEGIWREGDMLIISCREGGDCEWGVLYQYAGWE